MKIVPIDQMPKESVNTPLDNVIEIFSFGQKLEKLCKENNGVGLSAVQVGIPWKFFVFYDENSDNFNYMVDCKYVPLNQNKYLSIEGCLSIRNNEKIRHFKVMRHEIIRVDGKILEVTKEKVIAKEFSETFEKGLTCTIFQHEIDHHNNILISDIGEEIHFQEKIK